MFVFDILIIYPSKSEKRNKVVNRSPLSHSSQMKHLRMSDRQATKVPLEMEKSNANQGEVLHFRESEILRMIERLNLEMVLRLFGSTIIFSFVGSKDAGFENYFEGGKIVFSLCTKR